MHREQITLLKQKKNLVSPEKNMNSTTKGSSQNNSCNFCKENEAKIRLLTRCKSILPRIILQIHKLKQEKQSAMEEVEFMLDNFQHIMELFEENLVKFFSERFNPMIKGMQKTVKKEKQKTKKFQQEQKLLKKQNENLKQELKNLNKKLYESVKQNRTLKEQNLIKDMRQSETRQSPTQSDDLKSTLKHGENKSDQNNKCKTITEKEEEEDSKFSGQIKRYVSQEIKKLDSIGERIHALRGMMNKDKKS